MRLAGTVETPEKGHIFRQQIVMRIFLQNFREGVERQRLQFVFQNPTELHRDAGARSVHPHDEELDIFGTSPAFRIFRAVLGRGDGTGGLDEHQTEDAVDLVLVAEDSGAVLYGKGMEHAGLQRQDDLAQFAAMVQAKVGTKYDGARVFARCVWGLA